MGESRARKRIRVAVESRGHTVKSLKWEYPYSAGEMEGWAGGWELILDRPYLPRTHPGDDLYALNVDELLAGVDYWLKPEGDCGCDRRHSADMAARLKNDPQRPTHGPECRFHIRYRLPWWPKPTTQPPDQTGATG